MPSLRLTMLLTLACGTSPAPASRHPAVETRCALARVAESGAAVDSPDRVGAEPPLPRYGADAISYQGALFVVGGSTPRGFLGTVERFDPASETWTLVADGLVARRFLTAVVHDRHLF